MALSDWIWIGVILLLALYILRTAGNFYDDYIANVRFEWPGAVKYWWRRLRSRCQACGGALRGAPGITQEHNGRQHKICHWCVKIARHAQNYGMGDDAKGGGTY